MRTEYLIYFPDTAAYDGDKYLGILPQHYMLETSAASRRMALDAGGRDVSENDSHWREGERQQNLDYMHG